MTDKEKAHLGSLSLEQVRNIIALKTAYSEFWESVKFSKGWDSPVAEITDVLHLLEEAAEIVVRVRSYLDEIYTEPKFRIIDGSAKEFLWNLEKMPKEDVFLRDLVHATLMHSNKYVEGLTCEKLDALIQDIHKYNSTHQADKLTLEGKVLEDKILKTWNETDVLLKVTCAQQDKFWNSSLIKDMQQMWNQINNLKQRIILIQKKRDFNQKRDNDVKEQELEQIRIAEAKQKESAQEKEERLAREKLEAEAKAKQAAEVAAKAEEEARKKAAIEKDREGLLKITSVAKEAAVIEKELKEISEIAGTISKVKNIKPLDAIDKIGDLKKRCLKNSSKLMQDLLTLDELVGLQESRAAKKEQVAHIQQLLDNVENLKSRLNTLEVELQPLASRQKQEEELDKMADEELEHLLTAKKEKEKAKVETHSHAPGQIPVNHPATSEPAKPEHAKHEPAPEEVKTIPVQRRNDTVAHPRFDLKTAWNRLRLDPKIEVVEGTDSYTIMANIPGIHKDEIETTILPDGTLQISGVRVPTPEELSLVRRQIHSRYTPKSDEEEDMLVLKLGVGRFGRFVKKFQLPEGLDLDAIQGQYKDGIVSITVPKPKPAPRRQRDIPVNAYPFSPFMSDVPFWSQSNRF